MSNFWFDDAIRGLMQAETNLVTGDIRALLVMSNSDVLTHRGAVHLSDITILDECDGSNYARVVLSGKALALDSATHTWDLDCDPVVFATLGPGTRDNKGLIVYRHVGADSANVPLMWIDQGGFPNTGIGKDYTMNIGTKGLGQAKVL